MRSYPRNSPEAAARIVALMLIADGHVCRTELDALTQLNAAQQLGLPPEDLSRAVQTLCEDVLMGSYAGSSLMAQFDESALVALLAEVDEPTLQAKILALAMAVAQADDHLAEGEARVLATAKRHWCDGQVPCSMPPLRMPHAAVAAVGY